MNGPLGQHLLSTYSQHGEDGILKFIFGKLGITKGYFVEFGAMDGVRYSNTLALIEKGWFGVLIESDRKWWDSLDKFHSKWPMVSVRHENIGVGESDALLDDVLDYVHAPVVLDLLSIDIEGGETDIFGSMETHVANVVIIEIDSSSIDNMDYPLEMFGRRGYTLACHCGNLIFIRDELVEKLGFAADVFKNAASLFTPDESDWSE